MFETPKQLEPSAIVEQFTPDPNLSWFAAYAGPCGDDACTESHMRLYLIPIIGWLNIIVPGKAGDLDDLDLRPAIMAASGVVSDYLNLPDQYRFIAVVRADDNAAMVAQEIYHRRFKDGPDIVTESRPSVSN